MGARFIQDGKSVDYTPGSAVTAGDVVVQNDLVGVAKLDIAAGVLGALAVTGVFEMPKATGAGEAIAAGKKVYWTGVVVTTDSDDGGDPATAYAYVGKTIAAAGDNDATVKVRLEQ